MAFSELTNNEFAEEGYYEVANLLEDEKVEILSKTLEQGKIHLMMFILIEQLEKSIFNIIYYYQKRKYSRLKEYPKLLLLQRILTKLITLLRN